MRENTMVGRRRWASFVGTKRGNIAICSSSIDDRGRILASSHGGIWIFECYLRRLLEKNKNEIWKTERKLKKKKQESGC